MKVVFAELAAAQVDARRAWWRAHRAAQDVFDDELEAAVRTLAERAESLPIVRNARGRAIRRVLMPRSACHLYFEIDGENVIVVAAWGAARGRLPRL